MTKHSFNPVAKFNFIFFHGLNYKTPFMKHQRLTSEFLLYLLGFWRHVCINRTANGNGKFQRRWFNLAAPSVYHVPRNTSVPRASWLSPERFTDRSVAILCPSPHCTFAKTSCTFLPSTSPCVSLQPSSSLWFYGFWGPGDPTWPQLLWTLLESKMIVIKSKDRKSVV